MRNFDDYRSKLPYPSGNDPDRVAKRDARRLDSEFKEDALADAGLANHPKKDMIFDKAWEDGHASGYHKVFYKLRDLADFVRALEG